MDEYKEKELELQAFNKYLNKNHFLKRTLQLVVSVSIFSLVLCYLSGFSFFPHSFNVYFSTFLFLFFTHTLDRKYMFLVCNGILAFIVKCSVSSSTSSTDSAYNYVASDDQLSASELPEIKPASADVNDEVREENVESLEKVALQAEEDEAIQEKQKDQVEDREDEESEIAQEEDNNAELEAAIAVNEPSTDELSKKIEEFIRKMKEEIRIEAQQQLIAV